MVFAFVLGLMICALALVLVVRDYRSPPTVLSVYPNADEVGVETTTQFTLTFNRSMLGDTINLSTFLLRDDQNRIVKASITYQGSSHRAVLSPLIALLPGSTYQIMAIGGQNGMMDSHRRPIAATRTWKFTTGIAAAASPADGPGGPILLITSSANGFSQYYAEILRNEGFNEFAVVDISHIDSATLQKYDLVLLGEIPVADPQVRFLTDWVRAGGSIVAMRPEQQIVESFGLSFASPVPRRSPLHDAYIRIDSNTPTGAGLIRQPIQFHGAADRYIPHGATPLALLYDDANIATQCIRGRVIHFGRELIVTASLQSDRMIFSLEQAAPIRSLIGSIHHG
jgi:hypothetical protein